VQVQFLLFVLMGKMGQVPFLLRRYFLMAKGFQNVYNS